MKAGERKHSRNRIHILKEWYSASDHAILQTITHSSEHCVLQTILSGKLIEQTTGGQRRRRHAFNVRRED
jgi:hypothetical protein